MSSESKTIFILGAGVMQLPALRAAKEMGWRVIVADGSREAEGIPLADRFVHVDLKDRGAMTEAVKRFQRNGGVDGVFTAGTDFSATVAWVAEKCGLPGISFAAALNATDKVRMREAFRARGVPQPDFALVEKGRSPETVLEKLKFPLVVKPVDNMGARGVRRVDTPEELAAACRTALGLSRSGRVIVEEYVAGPEFSLDALVYQGKPTLCGIADRHIFFEPAFVEMGHTMPAAIDERTKEDICSVFFQGIRALGIDNGAAKGDIKLSDRGPVVGEIAARLSGGYMSGWTFPYASGVEVTRSALRIAVGLPPLDLTPTEHAWSAERAFISIPGQVSALDGLEEAKGAAGVKDLFVRVRAGATVDFPQNNVQKCGNVITKAGTREQAVASAVEALERIFIRLTPARPETDAFLFDGKTPHLAAFRLADELNRTAFAGLPGWRGDPRRHDPDRPIILSLPRSEQETGRDWHGLDFQRLLRIVADRTGAAFVPPEAETPFALGRLFWRALLKGGAQGAVYLLDTCRAHAGRPDGLCSFLGEERC